MRVVELRKSLLETLRCVFFGSHWQADEWEEKSDSTASSWAGMRRDVNTMRVYIRLYFKFQGARSDIKEVKYILNGLNKCRGLIKKSVGDNNSAIRRPQYSALSFRP